MSCTPNQITVEIKLLKGGWQYFVSNLDYLCEFRPGIVIFTSLYIFSYESNQISLNAAINNYLSIVNEFIFMVPCIMNLY